MPDYVNPAALTTGSRMRSQPLSSLTNKNYPPLVWYVGELDEHGAIYWVCDHKHSSDLEALGCAYTALEHYRGMIDESPKVYERETLGESDATDSNGG